jgi:hypothetical protein
VGSREIVSELEYGYRICREGNLGDSVFNYMRKQGECEEGFWIFLQLRPYGWAETRENLFVMDYRRKVPCNLRVIVPQRRKDSLCPTIRS